jgi:hypothetical protein
MVALGLIAPPAMTAAKKGTTGHRKGTEQDDDPRVYDYRLANGPEGR